MDLKYILTYFVSDKNWIKKYLIGSLLIVPSVLCSICNPSFNFMKHIIAINKLEYNVALFLMLIFFVVSIFASVIVGGYIAINNNLRIYKKEEGLAEWKDIKSILKVSFKMIAAWLIYMLILTVIYSVIIFLSSIIISFFVKDNLLDILPIAIAVTSLILLVFCCLMFLTVLISFSTDLRFSSFFNFKLMYNVIKNNKKSYLIYVLAATSGYLLLTGFNYFVFSKCVYVSILIPFLTFYISIVVSELLARVPRQES